MASTRFLILATIASLCIATTWALPAAPILGGQEAGSDEYPYVASLRLEGAHMCGGSIIDSKHILTAAHCVADKSVNALSVRVGSTNQFAGGKIHYVASVKIHPNYAKYVNDVAVLTLETELVWTSKIAAIALATAAADEPPVAAVVAVAGWGQQSSAASAYKLQQTTFTITTPEVCLDAFSGKDESNFCLAHPLKAGSCNGDAGNGAVYQNKLVAVSNYVVGACGSRYPDVFANVAYHSAWINEARA